VGLKGTGEMEMSLERMGGKNPFISVKVLRKVWGGGEAI